jgi:SWIM zinc finger
MAQELINGRKEMAQNERLIISLNEEGNFRVYSPAYPTRSYTVSGTPEGPKCTCPNFEAHKDDPEWKCQHMLAVLNLVNKSGEPETSGGKEPQPRKEETMTEAIRGLEMRIKRSVSRDDKINSLSITLSYPVESDSPSEVKDNADRLIGVLSEITDRFKQENGKASEQRSATPNSGNGSVPAQILSVGGMKGTWGGRRLFLNFDVNGQTLKLFGNRNELAKNISYAGFPDLSERIGEGTILNLPCRVVTKPSADGKYVNIERVYPIEALRFTRSPAK